MSQLSGNASQLKTSQARNSRVSIWLGLGTIGVLSFRSMSYLAACAETTAIEPRQKRARCINECEDSEGQNEGERQAKR